MLCSATVLLALFSQCALASTASRSRISPVMKPLASRCSGMSRASSSPSERRFAGFSRPNLAVKARGERTFTVDKPLGLSLSQSANGLTVKNAGGNAAKAGIKNGDTIIYTSSFFGDELWPSDKLSFTNSALKAAPSPVTIIVSDEPVDIKRLVARPAPKRFGGRSKLSQKQKELATHLCLDCGWIYAEETPFAQAANDFVCPQCNAGKKRFGSFDVNTGKITEPISAFQIINVVIVVLGLGVVGALGYAGLLLS